MNTATAVSAMNATAFSAFATDYSRAQRQGLEVRDADVLEPASATRLPELAEVAFLSQAPARRVALSWSNALGETHEFTGSELSLWAGKTAAFLAKRGVASGSVVAVALRSNYQLWFCALACARLGARMVALPEDADEARMAALLRESGAVAVVCTNQGGVAELVEHVVYACPEVTTRLLVNGDGAPALFAAADEADEACVPPAWDADGLPHGEALSGAAGVCALGCVRPGWLDFNTCVRVTPAGALADAASGATACAA